MKETTERRDWRGTDTTTGVCTSICDLSWPQIAALNKDRTIVFLTVAPLEEHGHHLPVSVDIRLGEHWRSLATKRLCEDHPSWNFLHMPPMPLAAGNMRGFPGCFYIRTKLLKTVMKRYLSAIASWGFRNMIVVASHGDPFHLIAIEKACDHVRHTFDAEAISPLGAMFSSKELGIDLEQSEAVDCLLGQYPNDFHAGWVETSMMLDIDSTCVGDYESAPDISVSEREMISPQRYCAKTAGLGHLGFPRLADRSLGCELNASSASYLVGVAERIICAQSLERYRHHFLYKIPFVRILV